MNKKILLAGLMGTMYMAIPAVGNAAPPAAQQAVASTALKTAESDWCTIQYPEKVEPGKKFTITVTPKEVPEGMKIGGDLHHASPGQYIGYAAWGGAPQDAKKGVPLTFSYRMPKFKSEDRGVQAIFFLTTKGWNESKKKAYSPVVLPLVKK